MGFIITVGVAAASLFAVFYTGVCVGVKHGYEEGHLVGRREAWEWLTTGAHANAGWTNAKQFLKDMREE